ncbi:hypothetical protein P0Y35_12020 [Kiritimatiellaeota bacterium B1221]|nr:hypothetical protein [Kiritimatiellaeota bacterium B1221]
MKKISHINTSWWVMLMAGIFLISLSFAFRFVREELDRVNRLAAMRQELVSLKVDSRKQLETLATLIDGQRLEPEILFAEWEKNGMLLFSEILSEELPEGYRHHQVTLSLENLPAGELSRIIHAAENAQPAWRLTSLDLVSSAGRLQGELLLEALDKSPSEL